MRARCTVLMLIFLAAMPLSANPISVAVVFVPLQPGEVDGAFGTKWTTTLWAHNAGDSDVRIECNGTSLSDCPVLPAHSTVKVTSPWGDAAPHGFFVNVRTLNGFFGVPDNSVWFEMRALDSVTAARSAGTEIPLALPSEFRAVPVIFPQVPLNGHSRLTLRIYGKQNGTVAVRAVGLTTKQELYSGAVQLTGEDPAAGASPRFASYAELALAPAASGDNEMLLEIQPSNGAEVWPLLSITDNESQQFTTVTAHSTESIILSVAKH